MYTTQSSWMRLEGLDNFDNPDEMDDHSDIGKYSKKPDKPIGGQGGMLHLLCPTTSASRYRKCRSYQQGRFSGIDLSNRLSRHRIRDSSSRAAREICPSRVQRESLVSISSTLLPSLNSLTTVRTTFLTQASPPTHLYKILRTSTSQTRCTRTSATISRSQAPANDTSLTTTTTWSRLDMLTHRNSASSSSATENTTVDTSLARPTQPTQPRVVGTSHSVGMTSPTPMTRTSLSMS